MAEVVLKDVDKFYEGNVHAVQGLSLDIADGEFLVLVGAVRLRQDDGAAHGRGARDDLGRDGLDR